MDLFISCGLRCICNRERPERPGRPGPRSADGDAGDDVSEEGGGKSLYVAKLSYRTTTPELEDSFSKFGKVQTVGFLS